MHAGQSLLFIATLEKRNITLQHRGIQWACYRTELPASSVLQGRWAITAGLNKLFDVFDCQVHDFRIEDNGMLHGDIDWRIQLNDGDFIQRRAVQTFKQVCASSPSMVLEHLVVMEWLDFPAHSLLLPSTRHSLSTSGCGKDTSGLVRVIVINGCKGLPKFRHNLSSHLASSFGLYPNRSCFPLI